MAREICLNLEREVLEGYEKSRTYDLLNVEALKIARGLGHQFPAVDVVYKKGLYQLVLGKGETDEEWANYGGHSRAICALQTKTPLRCRVLQAHRENPEKDKVIFYPIREMTPEREISYDSLFRLKRSLDYLPPELRARFIEENSLVALKDGTLIDKEDYLNPPAF